tara:strand:- start:693 stop:1526 length:834 start_codon:yes stop_codon:yes gene_type:complete
MSEYFDGINKLYTKKGYFDLYGGSFIIMIIILFTFFVFFTYYWILSNKTDIKKDWNSMKCHPGIIPFAGFINAPEGVDKVEYTKENFAGCFFNILKNITKVFTAPIQIIYTVLLNFYMSLLNSVDNFRKLQAFFLGILGLQFEENLKKTYGALVPLMIMLQKVAIIFKKFAGILRLFYYKLITIFKISKGMVQLLLDIGIAIFAIALAIILVLWVFAWFPGVWVIASTTTLIYVALLIIFILFVNLIKSIFSGLKINVLGFAGTRDNDDILEEHQNL